MRGEAGLSVSALAGGREATVLREGVGVVVVVADAADFLPCATEDTINTLSVSGTSVADPDPPSLRLP